MISPAQRLLNRYPHATEISNGWRARCPAHEDTKPSLLIAESENGGVLLSCHAGCTTQAVCSALHLKLGGYPWSYTVRCKYEHLYPVEVDHPGAATDRSGLIVRELRATDGVDIFQDGEDGANVVFHLAKLRFIARVMKPKSIRKLSSAQWFAGHRSSSEKPLGVIAGFGCRWVDCRLTRPRDPESGSPVYGVVFVGLFFGASHHEKSF